jgi:uncharacterized protein (TIGR04255 family)
MAFPDAPRVLYENNPLDEVICQLRFPPILRIDAEPPAGFQERVRGDYPFYESKQPLKLPAGLSPDLAQTLLADLPLAGRKSHSFGSRDQNWSVSMNRESLALTCRVYRRWEEFKERLAGPFEALIQEYKPSFFTRLGLRYRNVIRRSRLGMQDVPWGELLQPWISGVLGSEEAGDVVEGTQSVSVIRLPDDSGKVQMSFGLAIEERIDAAGAREQEIVFLIDADLFTEQQTEQADVFPRLDALNRQGGLLFRWCISGRLHDALRPGPVPSI